MRAILLLTIFVTLAIIIGLVVARRIVSRQVHRRRIEQLERENERLDRLNQRIRDAEKWRTP